LRDAGIECSVVDWGGIDVSSSDIQRTLDREQPDVVGLSVVAGPFIHRAIEISEQARNHGAKVLWGGHFPSLFPELCVRDGHCDFAVRGEGEVTLLDLVRRLETGESVDDVPGLSFRHDGAVVSTPDRAFIPDIDVLPFPAWDLLPDLERYVIDFYGERGFPLVTSRGCPFRCSFCYITPMWKRRWRPRSALKVVEEIRLIQSLVPKIDAIVFAEDIFAINRTRVEQFGRALKAEGLDLDWYCDIRADMMKPENLQMMVDAGCKHVYVGVESGSPRILDMILKDVSRDEIADGFRSARREGLNTTAIFMFGLPGETEADVRDTIDLARRIRASRYEFVVYVPYPGTPLYEDAVKWGFLAPKTVEGWGNVGLIEDFERLHQTNLTLMDAEFIVSSMKKLRRELDLKGFVRERASALWSVFGST